MIAKSTIGLITCIGIVACTPPSNTSYGLAAPKERWLSRESCAAPCWEGISPGTTLEEEAVARLKANSTVDKNSIANQIVDNDIGLITWDFDPPTADWSGRLVYQESTSLTMLLSLDTPDLCLGEIITAYGEPDYTTPIFDQILLVHLVWQTYGFVYQTSIISSNQGITADTCGGHIVQFPTDTPLNRLPLPSLYLIPAESFIPWSGYGSQYLRSP